MDLSKLTTENRNQESLHIDQMTTVEMINLINNEDKKVALAVEKVSAEIADATDRIASRFNEGGRIIYIGAGTSGRLGALDAIELTPTYSVSPNRAFGIMAGGKVAMFEAIEGAEDSEEMAIENLKEVNVTEADVVIGIAASGRTPYTISALKYANEVGALTVSVTCNQNSEMNQLANVGIAPIVGPEVITGSTRMKAGTAQKMILNMLSTAVMIKSGKVYQNLMINVQPTNKKLEERAISIIREATGVSYNQGKTTFEGAKGNISAAIVMIKTGVSVAKAEQELEKANGRIAEVVALMTNEN